MQAYNESYLRARNLKLELEEGGLWMLLVFIVPVYQNVVIENPAPGLMLPPHPPTNGYQAYQNYNTMYQDPSQIKTQPDPTYGTGIPYQPVMPDITNEGWTKPMIGMHQNSNPGEYNYYQPPIQQMQQNYDDQHQSPIMANICSNNIELQDDLIQIIIESKK
jgi:hypothetical protein